MDTEKKYSYLSLDEKYRCLQDLIASYQKVIIAYSGGVDSVFLLKVAFDCLGPANVLACIGDSESLSRGQLQFALEIAQQIGADVQTIFPDETSNPDYNVNAADRCYHCKATLYCMINRIAQEKGYRAILCGTNLDDLGDYRPGLKAAKDFNVHSPLELQGFTKDDIRAMSKKLELSTWDMPAGPCLASRIAYGQKITAVNLKQVEDAEAFLRQLGLVELRVRHHGDLARIEVPAQKIQELANPDCRQKIIDYFKSLGFVYVTLDMQGFRTGSANEVL